MNIESTIKVGNNETLSLDKVKITTSCVGFVHLFIPQGVAGLSKDLEIELHRGDLIEFMLRTQPSFSLQLQVNSLKTNREPLI